MALCVYQCFASPSESIMAANCNNDDPSNTPVGAPRLPGPITYVDPLPNDDTKPFYWTDAEEAKNASHFDDKPGRPAHPTGTITWNAVLSLGGVNNK